MANISNEDNDTSKIHRPKRLAAIRSSEITAEQLRQLIYLVGV